MENLTLVDFWAPLINFIVFALLLVLVARNPLVKMAKGRREAFVNAKEAADKVKREAEEKLAELNKEYNALQATISEIKSTAEVEAKREAEKIVENAKAVASNLEQEVKRIAETELALAKNELRRKIVEEVEKSVGEKIKSDFTPDMAKSFVSKQASRLDALN